MKGWMYALIAFILAGLGGIIYYFGFYKKEEETGTAQEKSNADNKSNPPASNQSTVNQNQTSNNDAIPAPVQEKPDGTQVTEIKQQVSPKSQGKPKVSSAQDNAKPLPTVGDVFTDIYAPQAKLKISAASRNGKALIQTLINRLLPIKERIVVDGKWGPKTQDAFAKVQDKIGVYGTNPHLVQYDFFVVSVIKFIHNYKAALTGIDMNYIKEFLREIPAEKVFIV